MNRLTADQHALLTELARLAGLRFRAIPSQFVNADLLILCDENGRVLSQSLPGILAILAREERVLLVENRSRYLAGLSALAETVAWWEVRPWQT